ncbi:four helix bundle protein [Pseudoalteromonas sp. B5MOD-1]|uniref:four helix bundle protein n=1 Tax=Pseudoalteromonas TaxID=53246 RepID=UPI0007839E68|nr:MULTISPECIES: four helix bundle protein [Pseudoalteromonas]KZY48211.1 four helix bundle protein [Pseudoalteromonas shioyasakiensis]MCO7208178.1 four helix bundle protein [Pseudoalteromonas sp. CnMc7-37]MCZ4252780.1 four helix bundle protein [Pseudoalteromonas shioyasakiensis]
MNFEKLEVWKRSARLSADIYKETTDLNDFGFRNQLTRSGLSIPSNIAEGMARVSKKERVRFLDISRSSIAETRTQIYIGIEIKYIDAAIGRAWVSETEELSKMLTSLMYRIEADS